MGPPSPLSSTALSAWLLSLTPTSKPSILCSFLLPLVGCRGNLTGLHIPPSLITPGLDLKRIDLSGASPLPSPDLGGNGGCETNQNVDDNEDTAVCILGGGGDFSRGRYRLGPLPPTAV